MKEQRKNPRRVPAKPTFACDLKLGSQVLPCLVLDESPGGWAMLVTGLPEVLQNQAVAVRDERGWYTARVVHSRPVLASAFLASEEITTDENELARAGELWLRLGVQRREKIAPASTAPDSLPAATGSGWKPFQFWRRIASLLP